MNRIAPRPPVRIVISTKQHNWNLEASYEVLVFVLQVLVDEYILAAEAPMERFASGRRRYRGFSISVEPKWPAACGGWHAGAALPPARHFKA